MGNGLDTANVWLAILAIASAVQALLFVVGALIVLRVRRNVTDAIAEFEQRHIVPLSARVAGVADDVRDVVGRVKQAEHDVKARLARLDDTAQAAKHVLIQRAWPIVASARAVSAAVHALAHPQSPQPKTDIHARRPRAVA